MARPNSDATRLIRRVGPGPGPARDSGSMLVDVCFLLELPYRFFLGVHVRGVYTDGLREIAAEYISDTWGLR
jgi:hypothetical protein